MNPMFTIVLAFVNILFTYFFFKLSVFKSVVSGNDMCCHRLWLTGWFWFLVFALSPWAFREEKVASANSFLCGDHSISISLCVPFKPFSSPESSGEVIGTLASFTGSSLSL